MHFFRWWAEQLGALFNHSANQSHHAKQIEVEIDSDGVRLSEKDGRKRRLIGQVSALESSESLLAELPKPPVVLRFQFSPGQYLQREISLPLAAESNLREAVGYQIERLAPFKSDQVVFACGLTGKNKNSRQLTAWLATAPLGKIQPVLSALQFEQPLNYVSPERPPKANESLSFNLLPANLGRKRRFPLLALLLVTNLVLLGGYVYTLQQKRLDEKAALQSQLSVLKSQANEAANLRHQLEKHQQARTTLQSYLDRPLTVNLLEELSQRITDEAWLERLEIRPEQIRLQGLATAATNLIADLAASSYFADVKFDASVTRDNRLEKERFRLSARLTPNEVSDE